MSFLKKHWRFTLPAVVVLCMLIIGVTVLYINSTPPESKTVYVMPERSPDNPPVLNAGGLPATQIVATNRNDETATSRKTTKFNTASGDIKSSDATAVSKTFSVDDHTKSPLSYEEAKAIAKEITAAESRPFDPSNLDGALERFKADQAAMNKAVALHITASPDEIAKALAVLSISQRNEILDLLRLTAADKVSGFVAQMNERGIYF